MTVLFIWNGLPTVVVGAVDLLLHEKWFHPKVDLRYVASSVLSFHDAEGEKAQFLSEESLSLGPKIMYLQAWNPDQVYCRERS